MNLTNKNNISVMTKKLSLFFIGFLLIPTLFLTSCDRGEEPGGGEIATPAFELLKDHMITNNLDIDKILIPGDAVYRCGECTFLELVDFSFAEISSLNNSSRFFPIRA